MDICDINRVKSGMKTISLVFVALFGMSCVVSAGDLSVDSLYAKDLIINPTPNSNGQGFSITQSPSGTNPPGNWAFNQIEISQDNTNYGPTIFASGFLVQQFFGGANATGGRLAIQSTLVLTAPTSNSNVNRNYIAGEFQAVAQSGDGGTAPTLGSAKGSIFAISPTARAQSGATNLEQLSGMEIDINAEANSSMRWKNGLIINYNTNDFTGGTQIDNMISLCRYNGPGTGARSSVLGAKVGIEFGYGDGGGDPIRTNGTLIKATSNSNPTVTNGIDFYDYNITGNLIQGKYSSLGDYGGLFIGAGPAYRSTNIVAQGGQPNIDIKIDPKGTGVVQIGNPASFSTGSHPTLVKWIKVKDDAGAVYYMPLYQ